MRAVITAGGTVDEAFAREIGTPVKALAPLGERTLLDVVLQACADGGIDGVAVVGGAEVASHLRANGARVIDAAEDGATNVARALDAWPGEPFVYLTSDLPFATGAALRALLARSDGLAVSMGLTPFAAFDARFPGAPPAGVTLRGQRVVNAGAFVFRPEGIAPVRAFAARFFDARKSPFAMARLLGPGLLARFALRRLGVPQIEDYARKRLGIPLAAVDCDPALCYDVDTLDEYRYACTRLA